MIAHNAQLTITCLLLEQIQIKEYQPRYLDQLHLYLKKLQDHPGEYAGLLSVVPSDTHQGMFALLDGHTRFCASIMAGRRDALCVVIEEPA